MSETAASDSSSPAPASAADSSALDQSARSIDEAREALSTVAANDDVSTSDHEEAGRFSEDPVEAAESADEITSGEGENAGRDDSTSLTERQPSNRSGDDESRDESPAGADDTATAAKADPSAS